MVCASDCWPSFSESWPSIFERRRFFVFKKLEFRPSQPSAFIISLKAVKGEIPTFSFYFFFSIVIHTIPFVARMSGEGMISNAFTWCIQVFRLESSTTRLRFALNEKYYLLLIIRYRNLHSK